MSVAGVPIDSFTGTASEFIDSLLEAELKGKTIDPYAIYGAQAAQIVLDAIADSDGSRVGRDREDVRDGGHGRPPRLVQLQRER